jgi:NADH-quinone oxidoreductase subunit J
MDAKTFLFYVFAAITVLSALRVVTARNPVHAALFLVLAFCTAAAIWMLLKAEFLAITLVLVYVGAVMVLFLFVVMMLDINLDQMRQGFWRNLPVALFVGVVVVLEIAAVLIHTFSGVRDADAPATPPGYSNTEALGQLLYTEYVYPFEIAAVVLLVAIVAAIALTLRRRKDSRYNDPSAAVRVRAADRVRLVRMPAAPRKDSAEDSAS